MCGDGNCGSVILNVTCPIATLPNLAFKDAYLEPAFRLVLSPWTL
jgi:hypothetical protein